MARFVTTTGDTVLIDDADLVLAASYRWASYQQNRNSETRYVVSSSAPRIYLHRLIMGVTDPKVEVDHRNGDGLDNRRSNLRVTTHALNLANQRPQVGRASIYKGVSRNRKNWSAKIKVNGQMRHLGTYPTEEQAARVYDAAALETWGEYARLNFPLVNS